MSETMINVDDAGRLLADCERHELRDHAFGDCEVTWTRAGVDVAFGYFGGDCAEVTIEGRGVFVDAEARALRGCGRLGAVERNDATGPDRYREGECAPGLTSDGVLAELTSGEETQ